MRQFYNTPSLRIPEPPEKPKLSAKEALYKLEDSYNNYRDDCNKGYCVSDPAVIAQYRADILAARKMVAVG